jgi:ABC-2 type transport system ATP-binding protein
METVIRADNLTKQYPNQKDKPAVDQLSLNIQKGTLYGLVGPDGAGKTTILRMLATVMTSSSGSASILGWDVRRESEKIRLHTGYMPQNFSLYPDMSVMENLNFFADINKVPKNIKKKRIDEMLVFTRLENFTKWRSENLSGGMKKKLALACSLIHSPEVLLLDEPSTGVDPVSRRELWSILARVIDQGVTILVSTPYMDEAERCHEVGILFEGKIMQHGSPDELKNNLDFEIIEVKAKPRKVIRDVVSGMPEVLSWRPVGDRLRVSAQNSNKAMESMAEKLTSQNAIVKFIRNASVNMEDVFIHLADHRKAS